MPIVYETAAPVAAAANIYSNLYRDGGGGGGGGVRGGGYNYGSPQPYDTGIQDAISGRDRMQFAQQSQAQEVQQRYDLARMAQEGAMAQQQQRFELQAQLHDVELSQQERMRLQRLKNSLGEVQSDATLTDQEKKDFTQQLKYNIDPLQRRLAQEKLAQDQQVKQALADQRTADAAYEKQRLDILAKTVEDRHTFVPDHQALVEITEDFTKNVGPALTAQYGPEVAKKLIGQMAQQEALKQGLGESVYLQPDGKLDRVKGGGAGSAGAGAGTGKTTSGGRGQTDHPSGLTSDENMKAYEASVKWVDERMKQKKKVGDAEEFVYPQTQEWREAAVEKEYQKRLDVTKKYNESAQPAGKRYQSRFAPPKAATAATPAAGERKSFDWSKPETPQQKADVSRMTGTFNEIRNSAASDEEKSAAAAAFDEIKSLMMKAGSYAGMDEEEKRKFDEARMTIAGVTKQAQKPAGPYSSRPTSAPEGRPWWAVLASGAGGGGGAGGGAPGR